MSFTEAKTSESNSLACKGSRRARAHWLNLCPIPGVAEDATVCALNKSALTNSWGVQGKRLGLGTAIRLKGIGASPSLSVEGLRAESHPVALGLRPP